MKYDVQIDFVLRDTTIMPEDISRITGIVPDVELLKGGRDKNLVLPRANTWSIRSHAESDDLVDHWNELEMKIREARDELIAIANTGTALFTIIINSDKRVPSIMIPPAMSRFAGAINAIIDIDHMQ